MNLSYVFAIISHAGLLIHTKQDISDIISNIFVTHKEKFPSKDEGIKLLDDCVQVLAAGLIPLPKEVLDQINLILSGMKDAINKI